MDTVTSVPKKVKDSVKASTSAVKRMSESMKNALSEVDSVKQSVANSTPPAVSNRSRKRSAAH